MTRNTPANLLDGGNEVFDRSMRQYFRERERRTHRQRLAMVAVLLFLSLLINASQLWLYTESLKVCGVRQ